MNALNDRIGASLRRSPYVWLTATILFFFVLTDGLVQIVKSSTTNSVPIALVGLGWIVVDLYFALVVYPRQVARGAPSARSENAVAVMNWTFAIIPFWATYGAVAAGGQQWVYAIGWITSVGLLVRAARHIHRHGAPQASAQLPIGARPIVLDQVSQH